MIDEELYKIATDELNSDERKSDVWARACALASDDHDEARFLYTNLRVEEMLNKDGKQRTFSTTRKNHDADLSSADKLDTLELSIDDHAPLESARTGVSNSNAPLPIDDILGYDANDSNTPQSVAGNALPVGSTDAFDSDTLTELNTLKEQNESTSGALSSLTGLAIEKPLTVGNETQDDLLASDIIDGSAENPPTPVDTSVQTPEAQRTAALSENLERQVRDMNQDDDPYAEMAEHASLDSNATDNTPYETVRTDYADTDILDEANTLNVDSELDTGVGPSFMVFSRNGALKAIKRGVSWPALFFTFPWLLSKALFGTALVYGCLWLVTLGGLLFTANQWLIAGSDASLAIKLWTAAFALLALVGLFYIPFRYGNRWLAEKLQNRGFDFESAVSASSKKDALNKLLDAGG